MKNNKKKILIVSSLLMISLIIGVSYALWRITLTQTNKNTMTTGCFKLTFEDANDINLSNAYPMSNEELEKYLIEAVPYHFKITNVCSSVSDISINLETLPVDGKKLPNQYVDFKLYNKNDIYGNTTISSQSINANKVIEEAIESYSLYTLTLNGKETREFDLLLYMNPDTPTVEEAMNATWKAKVTISSVYIPKEIEDQTLRNVLEYDDFYEEYMKSEDDGSAFAASDSYDVRKVVFQNKIDKNFNGTILAEFDESMKQVNTIRGYIVEEYDEEYDQYDYVAYIQSDKKMYFPENSSSFFSLMSSLVTIEGLEYVDTSRVKNMAFMFNELRNIESLDLSTFNTSNVENMRRMFYGMEALKTLNISSFDTKRVKNMASMFYDDSVLTSLNLANFSTPNVTDMSNMFYDLTVTELNLSGFDTRSVTNMEGMFEMCGNT